MKKNPICFIPNNENTIFLEKIPYGQISGFMRELLKTDCANDLLKKLLKELEGVNGRKKSK